MAVGLKIVDGDVVLTRSGTIEMVSQNEKCRRDAMKMLMTDAEYPDNTTEFERYNPYYGTELNNKSLYRGLSRKSIRDVVITILNESLQRYLVLQETRENLDYGEVITGLEFDVFYDVSDQRYLVAKISMTTALGSEMQFDDMVQYVG